jgi:hypothetical protein
MRRELGKLRTSIRQAMSWLRSRPTNAARLCVEWPTVKTRAARGLAREPVREGTAADEPVREGTADDEPVRRGTAADEEVRGIGSPS